MFETVKQRIIDRLGVSRIAGQADRLDAEVGGLRTTQAALLDEAGALRHELSELTRRVGAAEADAAWGRLATASAWSQAAPLRHTPTISVVLATRDRAALLPAAVESVLAQSYPHWQLVVADDGSTDGTAELLAGYDDPRVVVRRTEGVGAAAARNVALDGATGDYVTFLDDDNVMAAGWLRAVAEYTGRHPSCELLYGAQIREVEPGETAPWHSVAGLQLLFVEPYDDRRMRLDNYIDLGVVAVRRTLPGLRFDETLDVFIDWELIVRLAATTPPQSLPVIASIYRTGAAGRITASPHKEQRLAELRRRFAAAGDE
ncbi:MAG TPA: glycosyltransferase family A protein [Ilumatobacter sp.]